MRRERLTPIQYDNYPSVMDRILSVDNEEMIPCEVKPLIGRILSSFEWWEARKYPLVEIHVDDLLPSRPLLLQDKLLGVLQNGLLDKPIFVVQIDGDCYILDGHHRWWLNKEMGNTIISVHLAQGLNIPSRAKAVNLDLSDYYTSLYGIPIEVRGKKTNKHSADVQPDKLVFSIPYDFNPVNPRDDVRYEKLNADSFNRFVERIVKEYSHVYEKEIVEYNSTADLKRMTKEWANKVGIPMPNVSIRDAVSRWGVFVGKDGGTGNIAYHSFLKFVPPEVAEETVAHEIVHALQWYQWFNQLGYREAVRASNRCSHCKEFWDIFDRLMPNHRELKDRLEEAWVNTYSSPVPEDG